MWSPSMAIGVSKIDEQHKMLVEKAEELFDASKKNKAKEYIGELLGFLEGYTKQHFADEEAYMESIGYPGLAQQKAAHAGFIEKFTQLKKDYETSGSNLLVILNANQLIIDWLTNHISTMDKKIGEYAAKKQR